MSELRLRILPFSNDIKLDFFTALRNSNLHRVSPTRLHGFLQIFQVRKPAVICPRQNIVLLNPNFFSRRDLDHIRIRC